MKALRTALLSLVLTGCYTLGPVPAAKADDPIATMPDTIWTIIKNDCRVCHTYQPVPAGLDFSARDLIKESQLPTIGFGVENELAPFVHKLTPAVKDTLLDWVRSFGIRVPTYAVAQTFTFDQNAWMVGMTSPPRGWFWTNEDNWIDGATVNGGNSTHRWSLRDMTGGGTTYRALALQQGRHTSADSFPSSQNSSVYGVVGLQRHHGDFYDYVIEGDVIGTNRRWFSVFMHASEIKPPGRDDRSYVRLQFDRDAISLRSTPTDFETWPWGGSAGSPGADGKLVGDLNASGFYLGTSKWYHFVFKSERRTLTGGWAAADTLGTMYTAIVTDPVTHEVIADLWGIAIDDTTSSGTWGFHKYAASADHVGWANIKVQAKVGSTTWGAKLGPAVRERHPPELADPTAGDDTLIDP